jgi:O-acetylhomoserine/O-acetylserine sulfhydrylase-like pyridoxal-dependent enzyme
LTHLSTAESQIVVDPGLVQWFVVIEHADDLLADIQQSLEKA